MAVGVPVLGFVLFYVYFCRIGGERSNAVRAAALAWGSCVVGITEGLGWFAGLTAFNVLLAWGVVDAAVLGMLVRGKGSVRNGGSRAALLPAGGSWRIAGVVGVVAATFMAGVLSAPNTWDSMIYHLSRVMHWISNRSVGVYPTNCLTQLYHQPWAEWAMMQFQILSGGDRLAFFIPWAAMLGCVVISMSIARKLGADAKGQVIAAVLVATLPSGVLQAESTQNNYPLAFWLMCGIDAILEIAAANDQQCLKRRWFSFSLQIGAAFGLAFLTKATAFVYALPLLLWLSAELWRRRVLPAVRMLALAALVAAALNSGHALRIYRWSGSPFMPDAEMAHFRVDRMSPQLWLSNAARNVALHLNTPSASLNEKIERAFVGLHGLIGIAPDDSRITFPHDSFHLPRAGHEDSTGAPVQVLLVVFTLGFLLITPFGLHPEHRRTASILLIAPILGFAGFCATVKWQPFHARLHLPLLVIAAPSCALVLSRIRHQKAVNLFIVFLFAGAAALIAANPNHALIGPRSILHHTREEQYFIGRPELFADYQRAADLLKDSSQTIGLATDGTGWEYPLWVFLKDRMGRWPRIVAAPSSRLAPQPTKADLAELSGAVVLESSMSPLARPRPEDEWKLHDLEHLHVWIRTRKPEQAKSAHHAAEP